MRPASRVVRLEARADLGHVGEQGEARLERIHEAVGRFQILLRDSNGDALQTLLHRLAAADRVFHFPPRAAFLARALRPLKNWGSTGPRSGLSSAARRRSSRSFSAFAWRTSSRMYSLTLE